MNKAVKYGLNGALIGGIGNGIINAIKQLSNCHPATFDWLSLFKAIGKGALVVGGSGALIGVGIDYFNSRENPIDTDMALLAILRDIQLNKNDSNYQQLHSKSEWLIEIIQNDFADVIKNDPYRFGSTENGTAIKENFDIDICVSFKPGSFTSTADMYFSVFERLKMYIGTNGVTGVRDQRKSIGVFFSINGREQKIDILPHKLTKARGNRTSGYLHVNNKGLFEKSSRTKTDITLLNSITLSDTQSKILIALKRWKSNEQLPVSSHLLKYLLLEAYSQNRGIVPRKFTDKVIMVLEYIERNIDYVTVRSVENTNNVLTNISNTNKTIIRKACRSIIDDYLYQPNSIVSMIK